MPFGSVYVDVAVPTVPLYGNSGPMVPLVGRGPNLVNVGQGMSGIFDNVDPTYLAMGIGLTLFAIYGWSEMKDKQDRGEIFVRDVYAQGLRRGRKSRRRS